MEKRGSVNPFSYVVIQYQGILYRPLRAANREIIFTTVIALGTERDNDRWLGIARR